MKILDHDIVFLSYDEPNADANYQDLVSKVPWAKRVHGIKGSDTAHKACARIAETDRFIIVDGDNIVKNEFINSEILLPDEFNQNSVISWSAKNVINGLIYGNGGIKSWHKNTVFSMKTHENANEDDIESQVDFCWKVEYYQVNECMSIVHNNATPYQAWRAGFREGVKMSLINGKKPTLDEFHKIFWKNKDRLLIWMMVGDDVDNGYYSILGARQALYMLMCTDWNYIDVRDFDKLKDIFEKNEKDTFMNIAESVADELNDRINLDIPKNYLTDKQSAFFKQVYKNFGRMNDRIILG